MYPIHHELMHALSLLDDAKSLVNMQADKTGIFCADSIDTFRASLLEDIQELFDDVKKLNIEVRAPAGWEDFEEILPSKENK